MCLTLEYALNGYGSRICAYPQYSKNTLTEYSPRSTLYSNNSCMLWLLECRVTSLGTSCPVSANSTEVISRFYWCVSRSCVPHWMAQPNGQTLTPLRFQWLTPCHNVLPDDRSNHHLRIVFSMFFKPRSQLPLRFILYMHMSQYKLLWFAHAVKVQPRRYCWKWGVNSTTASCVTVSMWENNFAPDGTFSISYRPGHALHCPVFMTVQCWWWNH